MDEAEARRQEVRKKWGRVKKCTGGSHSEAAKPFTSSRYIWKADRVALHDEPGNATPPPSANLPLP